jgi:hypothetical protein
MRHRKSRDATSPSTLLPLLPLPLLLLLLLRLLLRLLLPLRSGLEAEPLLASTAAVVVVFADHHRARIARGDILRASVAVLVSILDAERPSVRVLPRARAILYVISPSVRPPRTIRWQHTHTHTGGARQRQHGMGSAQRRRECIGRSTVPVEEEPG